MKRRDFKFIGPVSAYLFLQACALINDCERTCFRFDELASHDGAADTALRLEIREKESSQTPDLL